MQEVAMCNAWPMHGKCTCGARCVKYTTNEPNMFLMRKHVKPQSLVLIGVQTSEKMLKRHFIKHLECTLWTTMWNNAWTSWNPSLIHALFAIRGNIQSESSKETNPIQNLKKKKKSFPNPYDENSNQEHKTLHNII